MAHSCPTCYSHCHCGGDIDDITMDDTEEEMNCTHCNDYDDDDADIDPFRCEICGKPLNGESDAYCTRCDNQQDSF